MEHLIGSILVWFIVGFLYQLCRYPKKKIKLSTVEITDPPPLDRGGKVFGFWITWALFGMFGICIYWDRIGIIAEMTETTKVIIILAIMSCPLWLFIYASIGEKERKRKLLEEVNRKYNWKRRI